MMNKETELVWTTKYALSKGIYQAEVRECGCNMVCERSDGFDIYYHGEGREWHRTKESAVKRAEEMRTKKIASLKKQIQKLEKMCFAEGEENGKKDSNL